MFEIQLSTTFLDVIIARETFYQKQKIFILWVFADFTKDGRLFTEKDTYVANQCNAFVLDEACIAQSREQNTLVLRCHYKIPYIEKQEIYYKWEDRYVTLEELTFDIETYKVYYFNFDQREIETRALLEQYKPANAFERYWIEQDALSPDDRYAQDRAWIRKFSTTGLIPAEHSHHEHFPNGLFQLLNALYSLKHQRMIGFRYKNNIWQQMTHSFLSRHPQFAGAYIAALKHFHMYDKLMANDKKDVMKTSIAAIRDGVRQDDPAYRQNLSFKLLLKSLFHDVF